MWGAGSHIPFPLMSSQQWLPVASHWMKTGSSQPHWLCAVAWKKWVLDTDRITQHWRGFCYKTLELSDVKDQTISSVLQHQIQAWARTVPTPLRAVSACSLYMSNIFSPFVRCLAGWKSCRETSQACVRNGVQGKSGRFSAQGSVSTIWGEAFGPVTPKRLFVSSRSLTYFPLPFRGI